MRATAHGRLGSTTLVVVMLAAAFQAEAALLWNWSYSGAGIAASGTLSTNDTPDAGGYYAITGISGQRNGVTITGLQPTGTPIPGNEPFAADNLLRVTGPQLKKGGIGFALADGTYANPIYADFLPTPGYLEFFSAPPFATGAANAGPEDSELRINFTAQLVVASVPQPGGFLLVLADLAAVAWCRSWCRCATEPVVRRDQVLRRTPPASADVPPVFARSGQRTNVEHPA
ncbi:MAG: PEP-CTERM sorting domain-containing protein [Gammaproteobacteria bacterium]